MIPPNRYALGQIWRNERYYLSDDGQWKPKFEVVLAQSPDSDDVLTACFTSKPHGLTDAPACCIGPQRFGYYVGLLGKPMELESWVDFKSVDYRDPFETNKWFKGGFVKLSGLLLTNTVLRDVLECLKQSDDLKKRQSNWIHSTLGKLPRT
ncbi:hypothetical protein LMG2828_01750 [Achromobacter piechaudii]|nr:hypothetical protein LMG2828_01750 [Achromobacter piechaudii]